MQPKPMYVAVKALIFQENTLLMVLKNKENFWDFPGGRIDPGESIVTALKRELAEELPGFTHYKIKKLVGLRKKAIPLKDGNELLLTYYLVEGTSPQNTFELSDEHTQYKFFTLDEIEQLEDPFKEIYTALMKRVLGKKEVEEITEESVII